jgi:hypothetical protein
MSHKRPPTGGKVDANQAQIVRELRAMGFRVDIVSQLKKLYDLVVTGQTNLRSPLGVRFTLTVRVEIKMPGCALTFDEQEYWDADAFRETLIIAYETEDVLKWFGRI